MPPLIGAYNPDVIVFELGADTLAGDPLAHLHLTNNAYVEIIKHLLRFNKPILATGGGGYHVENTVRAWALAWTVLSGQDVEHGLEAAMGGVMLQSTDWQGGLARPRTAGHERAAGDGPAGPRSHHRDHQGQGLSRSTACRIDRLIAQGWAQKPTLRFGVTHGTTGEL